MTAYAINERNTPLAELEARIESCPLGALTLDPSRLSANSLTDVVSKLAEPRQLPHLTESAAAVAEDRKSGV